MSAERQCLLTKNLLLLGISVDGNVLYNRRVGRGELNTKLNCY